MSRPVTKTLASACREFGKYDLLISRWAEGENAAIGLNPESIGFKTHVEAYFRCFSGACKGRLFLRQVSNWMHKDRGINSDRGPECNACQMASGGIRRRVDSLAALAAAGDPACAVLQQQWDICRNGTPTPDEVSAANKERVFWRCSGCKKPFPKAISPKNRYYFLRKKLSDLGVGVEEAVSFGAWGCPNCTTVYSFPQLALGAELRVFFRELRQEHLDDLEPACVPIPIVFSDGTTFAADIVLLEDRIIVEYDGFEFHRDDGAFTSKRGRKSDWDRDRTLRVQKETGWRVLRVREVEQDERLPDLPDVAVVHVPVTASVPEKVVVVLRGLRDHFGVVPTVLDSPDVDKYERDKRWYTQEDVQTIRIFLEQHATTSAARLRRLTQPEILDLYAAAEMSGTKMAESLGVSLMYLSSTISESFGKALTQMAEEAGLPVHHATQRALQKPLARGGFDKYIGNLSDTDVARMAGVSTTCVYERRLRLGVPDNRPAPHVSKVEPFRHLLGTMTDLSVSKVSGLGRSAIKAYRMSQNIPSFRPPRPKRAAT